MTCMTAHDALKRWHQIAENSSKASELASIMREDAVSHSPVVHTPQEGRPIVVAYLSAAGQTLGNANFRYTRKVVGDDTTVLEFETEMDGIKVNGIDMINFDEEGKIKDFKVWSGR